MGTPGHHKAVIANDGLFYAEMKDHFQGKSPNSPVEVPKHHIQITVVNYYESQGKLLKKYLDGPVILNSLGSVRFIIPEKEKIGGSGANFIVEWKSKKLVNPPTIESVMIGTQAQQGISFTSRGRVIMTSD